MRRSRKTTWRAWVAGAIAVAVWAAPAAGDEKTRGPAISFDTTEGLTCRPGYKCVKAAAEVVEHDAVEGSCSVKTTWRAAADNYGVMNLLAAIPETDFAGKSFAVRIKPLNADGAVWGLELHDAGGVLAEEHRMFQLGAGRWHNLIFTQGGKTKNGYYKAGKGDIRRITRIVFRAQTRGPGQVGQALWDDFRILSPVVDEQIKRAAKPPDTPAALSAGETAVWLDASRGHALSGIRLAGRWLEPSLKHVYPTFKFVDAAGAAKLLPCTDPGWKVTAAAEGPAALAVTYAAAGATMKVRWTAAADHVQCDVTVVSENALKAAEVGAERIFGTVLQEADYGIPPTGSLPKYTKEPIRIDGAPKRQTALFVAAKAGDRIVYYKPLTASQEMQLAVRETGGVRLAWMGGSVRFRPREFKDPATRLCHETLSWRAELAGDVNGDGGVDWVDAAIAYRQRYIKSNPGKSARLRDSFRFYHPLYVNPAYEHLLKLVERIDFATGVWWMKGMMRTNMQPVSEAHPYAVARYDEAGDLSRVKKQILARGSILGPYYGHDYIDTTDGGWPDELIKRDAAGGPHKYYVFRGRQLFYKDNVRGLAGGALKRHYEQILSACWLERGDTIMLDTFTAYARPGYHPEFPATVQKEIDAKRELARWLKYDKGLVVAAEGIVEGTQDVIDCAANSIELREFALAPGWVPLKTVIFHGSTYFGAAWYSIRHPRTHYAAALVNCVGLWDWSTMGQGDLDHMYAKTAQDYFMQDIFWSRIADHKIVAASRRGTEWRYTFDNGSILAADPERRTWWLEEAGVRYDGFTPFNNVGVMAVIKQGDVDILLPVKEMLEIIPSQPNREKLDIAITRAPDGRIRVKGNFSKAPFRVLYFDEKERKSWIDSEPVLMLRRVARFAGQPKK